LIIPVASPHACFSPFPTSSKLASMSFKPPHHTLFYAHAHHDALTCRSIMFALLARTRLCLTLASRTLVVRVFDSSLMQLLLTSPNEIISVHGQNFFSNDPADYV